MKRVNILILGLLLSACSTGYQALESYNTRTYAVNQTQQLNDSRLYSYNEILIINHSQEIIQDVTITAGASGRRFSCGNIAPLGYCSDKFPSRRYLRNPVQIGWIIGNLARQTRDFVLEVPTSFDTATPIRGVLVISAEGTISAHFEQDNAIN